MPEVITFGEPLVLFTPKSIGLLRHQNQFTKSIGGAELNTAIGLARLGVSSGWFGQVGDDEFGHEIVNILRSEAVDTRKIRLDTQHPTGVMFKEYRTVGEPNVYYYRQLSASSFIESDLLTDDYLQDSKIVHTTGITVAISENSYNFTLNVLQRAKAQGIKVSFDPNIRLRLMNKDTILDLMRPFIELSDVLLLGQEEGSLLFKVESPEEIVANTKELGVRIVAVKLGSKGNYVSDKEEEFYQPPFMVPEAIDTVGAGDGFNAGFLAGLCKDFSLQKSAELASIVGGYAVTVQSDYQGYPTRKEIDALIAGGNLYTR